MAYSLSNKYAKNLCKRAVQLIIENVVTFFCLYCISKHALPITIRQNIMCKCAKSFSFWGTEILNTTSSLRPATGALSMDPTGGLPSPEPPDWPMFILSPSRGIVPPFEKKFQKSPPPQKKKLDENEEPEARIHGWMTLTKSWSRFAFTV